jgi:hypothetical protein
MTAMTAMPTNTSSAKTRSKPIGPLEKTLRAMREALAELDDALETAGHARTDLRRRLQALEDMIAPFNPDSEFSDA